MSQVDIKDTMRNINEMKEKMATKLSNLNSRKMNLEKKKETFLSDQTDKSKKKGNKLLKLNNEIKEI